MAKDGVDGVQENQEFLYMDPDSGMFVTMLVDDDGFRAAHASDELITIMLKQLNEDGHYANTQTSIFACDEKDEVTDFIEQFQQAYPAG